MVNVHLPSKSAGAAVTMSALLASSFVISSVAAYGRYSIDTQHYRPPLSSSPFSSSLLMPLGSRYFLPNLGTPANLVARRDAQRRAMLDELLDAMLSGGGHHTTRSSGSYLGLDELLYDPFPFQRMMDSDWPLSSYLVLQGLPPSTLNELIVPSSASTTKPTKHATSLRNTFGITQDDDTQLQIVVHLPPGTTAHDVNLNLNEDTHALTVSGETKREEGGISVHSRFDRSYTLHPHENVDVSKITAQLDNEGVLTIVAPKYPKEDVKGKDNMRTIDIVEQQMPQQDVTAGEDGLVMESNVVNIQQQQQEKNIVTTEMNADDSVIDLDVK